MGAIADEAMRAAESKAGVQSAQGMENGSQDELSGSESLGEPRRPCTQATRAQGVCGARGKGETHRRVAPNFLRDHFPAFFREHSGGRQRRATKAALRRPTLATSLVSSRWGTRFGARFLVANKPLPEAKAGVVHSILV